MAQQEATKQETAIAKKGEEPKNVTTLVRQQVERLTQSGGIMLPKDYSVANALKSAWFAIQDSEQKDKILACTPESQVNALFNMVVQGLDIGKKQGYLIPYGNRLMFQRSYFGDIALAQSVKPGISLYYDVIRKGEVFKVAKTMTPAGFATTIQTHDQAFPRESNEIVGAYCGTVDENGVDLGITLMDMDQIRTSWKKSKTYGPNSNTFHNEQPDIACIRTVVRRHTKAIINSSDSAALLASINEHEQDSVLAEVDAEIAEKGNGEVIDIAPQLTAKPDSQEEETGKQAEGQQTLEVEEEAGTGGAQPSF